MTDELIIRIEDDEQESDEPTKSPFKSDDPFNKPTMESLFGEQPWWLDPEYINNTVGTTERISYPTKSPPEKGEGVETQDECEYAPYFERIIQALGSIWETMMVPQNPSNGNQQQQPSPTNPTNGILGAIQRAVAQINTAQFLNNPINATANTLGVFGNLAANVGGQITTATATAILTPLLGSIGPIAGQIIGMTVGTSIGQFFNVLSESIRNFFDYTARITDEVGGFSPDIINAQVSRNLQLLDFRIGTGQNFGKQFADVYAAQTALTVELEKLKLELFAKFEPLATEGVRVLSDIIGVIRIVINEGDFTLLNQIINTIVTYLGELSGISAALEALQIYFGDLAKEIRRGRELDEKLEGLRVNRETMQFFGWVSQGN